MASVKTIVILLVASLALAAATPIPEPGGWGKKHTHYIIHVPYHVHTVHHHHVKKVHVPVYIEKHIPVHHEHHEEHHPVISSHGGWDWDK